MDLGTVIVNLVGDLDNAIKENRIVTTSKNFREVMVVDDANGASKNAS